MTRAKIIRALCLTAVVFVINDCAGDSPNIESGSECWDGKDNDGDQLIDCKDSDCGYLEICGQQPDQGVPDKAVPDKAVPDKAPPPDQAPPPDLEPDTTPTSMFGRRCQYSGGQPELCADGETYCVPPTFSTTDGFCTHKCPTFGQPGGCPPVPEGQRASCFLELNDQPYCLFVCGRNYDCPHELSCIGQGQCH